MAMTFPNSETNSLRIEMFGGFVVMANDKLLTKQVKRSSKIWKLIQYLIVFRHKSVSQEELIGHFCSDEQVSNPSSSLRTMIFRARAALSSCGMPGAENMILSGSGGYRWNNNVPCLVDAEEFDVLLAAANSVADMDERLELLLQVAMEYKGEFLPNASGELWVMPLARKYRTAFLDSAFVALELLGERGRFKEAEALSEKALRTDPFNEEMLEVFLRCLITQGKNMQALEEYRKMEAMYYDVLGVALSEKLSTLQTQMQHPEIREDMSLENMLDEWLFGADFPGAFYCDVAVFKSVCQIEARSAARSGRTVYIIRIDVDSSGGDDDSGAMKQLSQIIPQTLRKGDLYTRLGSGQFMLMLSSLTMEDCGALMDRMLALLDEKHLPSITKTSIEPIKPIP